ncbi:YqkE family protein [Paenibacillus dendritiformis]|uniref:YqkE family protein n=1 Tax=Paenibacillus dendritiformis TaxID=130049 RepID=UPI00248C6DE6|nr:YqkE family protein [Paenibacillus dendritiformis]WGU93986.1 YqkE family protein [Paenibacillus dendritiformis]
MAKKRGRNAAPQGTARTGQDQPATLKDLLRPDVVAQLKAQATVLKAEEVQRKEEARRQAEEARTAEQKRLDNDFDYLLNNSSMDWRKYK